ncbi:MAG: hypothetical protein H6721_21235 [Sandaracinus sp.]|nr:hypothetical protein [Myxococcales bacterium]MCB9616472.1 hypothetical protein [Sandaracinus sp.]MCB9634658.1 hypothetical protein [Sandaracinus sp.]
MLEFFRAGGWPMFVVLLFGGLTLAAAIRFARQPRVETVGTVRALSTATVFAALGGLVTDLAAVFHHVPNNPEWAQSPQVGMIVLVGLAESMAPAMLGFAFLSMAWLVTAVGTRRLSAEA